MVQSKKPFLIGVAGTNCAGKDTVGEALQRHGFYVVSASRDVITEYARKHFNVTAEEAKERSVLSRAGNQMRELLGPAAVVHVAIDHYQEEEKPFAGLAVTSLRTLAEAEAVQSLGGIVVYVDAPAKLRWQRAQSRARDKEAKLSFDEFVANEQIELKGLSEGDPKTVMHIEAIGEIADLKLFNEKNGIEEFEEHAYEALHKLMPS